MLPGQVLEDEDTCLKSLLNCDPNQHPDQQVSTAIEHSQKYRANPNSCEPPTYAATHNAQESKPRRDCQLPNAGASRTSAILIDGLF